jgi:copper(I)-binding protein
MSSVTAIPLPTGATVTLAPGGLHVMLIDIRAPLKAGEQVPLMLEFASGARLTIEATVRDARAAAAAGH